MVVVGDGCSLSFTRVARVGVRFGMLLLGIFTMGFHAASACAPHNVGHARHGVKNDCLRFFTMGFTHKGSRILP